MFHNPKAFARIARKMGAPAPGGAPVEAAPAELIARIERALRARN